MTLTQIKKIVRQIMKEHKQSRSSLSECSLKFQRRTILEDMFEFYGLK